MSKTDAIWLGCATGSLIFLFVIAQHYFAQKSWTKECQDSEAEYKKRVAEAKFNGLPPSPPPGRIIKEGFQGYKQDLK